MATEADAGVRVVPANEASWDDLQQVFGARGQAAVCQCQRYKLAPGESFGSAPVDERALRLREQTGAGDRDAPDTAGLVAFLGAEPVGWCAVQPRVDYGGLLRVYRIPWQGRSEDKAGPGVWAVTCLFTRAGYRGRGVTYALVAASVDFARARGATAIEGYPILPKDGGRITWGEEHVGFPQVFAAAGFVEVSSPGVRRRVMRIDFA